MYVDARQNQKGRNKGKRDDYFFKEHKIDWKQLQILVIKEVGGQKEEADSEKGLREPLPAEPDSRQDQDKPQDDDRAYNEQNGVVAEKLQGKKSETAGEAVCNIGSGTYSQIIEGQNLQLKPVSSLFKIPVGDSYDMTRVPAGTSPPFHIAIDSQSLSIDDNFQAVSLHGGDNQNRILIGIEVEKILSHGIDSRRIQLPFLHKDHFTGRAAVNSFSLMGKDPVILERDGTGGSSIQFINMVHEEVG